MTRILIASVLTFCCSGAIAQLNVSVGPSIGFGHSWLEGEDKNKFHSSGNVGVSVIHSATAHLGIGLDLKYSVEGGEKKAAAIAYTNQLKYLRIPVKAIYFFGEYGDRVRPKISLGPSMGILVGGTSTLGSTEYDAQDVFKTLDLGLLGNAGLHIRLLPNIWLTLDAGYYHGLSDISSVSSDLKNRNIQLNAGLAFGFARSRSRY